MFFSDKFGFTDSFFCDNDSKMTSVGKTVSTHDVLLDGQPFCLILTPNLCENVVPHFAGQAPSLSWLTHARSRTVLYIVYLFVDLDLELFVQKKWK